MIWLKSTINIENKGNTRVEYEVFDFNAKILPYSIIQPI